MNKIINKKLIMLFTGILAVAGGIAAFSAYEAHIINVTAHIENALAAMPEEIHFGTVFPQEYLERELNINLSNSFLAEGRVDDVEYVIKQKPKPKNPDNPVPEGFDSWHEYCGQVSDLENCYPLLCPYILKIPDGIPDNDTGVLNMHDPGITILEGRLAKSESDFQDIWKINLDVPCFEGMCAQDWTHQGYELDPVLEHEDFGCDLWVEVTGISEDGVVITDHDGEPGDGCESSLEICNGLDDNCNGEIDEGLIWANKGQECSVGIGQCSNTGVYVCDPNNPSGATICSVQAGESEEEICDGLDNNCNAEIDEGDVCGQQVFGQDFNSLAIGDLNGQGGGSGFSGNWSAANVFDVQGDVTYEGSKAVKVSGENFQESADRSISSPISQGTVYFAARKDSIGGSSLYLILKEGGVGKMYVVFGGPDGNIKIYDYVSGDYQVIQPYSANTWYKIAIEFDDSAQDNKYRAMVYDGVSWSPATNWYTVNGGSYSSIDGIGLIFHVGGTMNEAYVDTIVGN